MISWLLLLALAAFGGIYLFLERPVVPFPTQRLGYRLLNLLLLALLACTVWKALAYRQELRFQIRVCPSSLQMSTTPAKTTTLTEHGSQTRLND